MGKHVLSNWTRTSYIESVLLMVIAYVKRYILFVTDEFICIHWIFMNDTALFVALLQNNQKRHSH